MGCFKILNSGGGDVTVVSNFFIDEYMKDANDAQIKVYLYLLRMMTAGLTTSVSDIADKFNHTEKDVLRALKYWEKAGLLSLEFDQVKTIVKRRPQDGIRELRVILVVVFPTPPF